MYETTKIVKHVSLILKQFIINSMIHSLLHFVVDLWHALLAGQGERIQIFFYSKYLQFQCFLPAKMTVCHFLKLWCGHLSLIKVWHLPWKYLRKLRREYSHKSKTIQLVLENTQCAVFIQLLIV